MTKKHPIIFFADQWDMKYRRRQQFAMRFAQLDYVRKVIYVEIPLTITSLIKYIFKRADAEAAFRWKRVFKHGFIYQVSHKNVVITPLAVVPLTIHFDWARRLNFFLCFNLQKFLINKALKDCENVQPILWVSHPVFTGKFLGLFNEIVSCYDSSDNLERLGPCYGLTEKVLNIIRSDDELLSRNSHLVFMNSLSLFNAKKLLNEHTYHILNGVDSEFFKKTLTDEIVIAEELRDLKSPIIGYTGSIDENLDFDLLEKVSEEFSKGSIVLIGSPSLLSSKSQQVLKRKNIHLLGVKEYLKLPEYLKGFDACINFYTLTEKNRSATSLKIIIYIAAGKKVVSTDTAGAAHFAGGINISKDSDDFIRQLKQVLNDSQDTTLEQRLELVKKHDWTNRITEISALILNKLNEMPHVCQEKELAA